MSLKIASWNTELRLSRYTKSGRGSPEHIVNSIKQLNADIIFMPESYDANRPIDIHIAKALKSMHYTAFDVPYEEGGNRPELEYMSPYLRLMSRIPITDFKIFRLGTLRNALICIVKDPETKQKVRIIGIHLDDRSEALRLSEMPDLMSVINSSNLPTVMVGDYNSMNGSTRKARILRSRFVRWLSNHLIPHKEVRSYAIRATEMATGSILCRLESETGLHDVDSAHKPTTTPKLRTLSWMPSVRLIDIDHMLVSDSVKVTDFIIAKHDGGSDHRSISATIYLS